VHQVEDNMNNKIERKRVLTKEGFLLPSTYFNVKEATFIKAKMYKQRIIEFEKNFNKHFNKK
jgi:hypothetical protein